MARSFPPDALKAAPSRLPATLKPKVPNRISSRLPKLPNPNEPDVFEEMTLLEHMEELRDRIIKSVIAIGLAFVAGIFLAGPLLKRLQVEANATTGFDVVSPTDPITIYFKIALYIAIGLALPVLMWQLVGFLAPGLTQKEKRFLILSLPFVVLLFLLGVAYGFFFAAVELQLHHDTGSVAGPRWRGAISGASERRPCFLDSREIACRQSSDPLPAA
jgi:sec-independent protein translocase protein TatC